MSRFSFFLLFWECQKNPEMVILPLWPVSCISVSLWSLFPFTSEYVAFLLSLVVFIWLQPHETAFEYFYFLNECKPSYFSANSSCAPCFPCSLILGRTLSAPPGSPSISFLSIWFWSLVHKIIFILNVILQTAHLLL